MIIVSLKVLYGPPQQFLSVWCENHKFQGDYLEDLLANKPQIDVHKNLVIRI